MAKKVSGPGRTLIVFTLAVLAMFVGLAVNGVWSPKLGLDLQGGTRITLEASTDTGEAITAEKLEEAAGIIDSRVNASGVAESEVSTQGERNIIVEIPGENRRDLVDTVKQTAQLRFRLVAQVPQAQAPLPQPSAEPSDAAPSDRPSQRPSGGGSDDAGGDGEPAGRPLSEGLLRADASPSPTYPPSADPAAPGAAGDGGDGGDGSDVAVPTN